MASAPRNSNRMRSDGIKLLQGRVRLDIRKNLSKGVVRYRHSSPGGGGSLCLKVLQSRGDVALGDMF